MRRQGRKVAILFLAMVVCFTGLAVGYGHWTDVLQADVNILTLPGGACLEFSEVVIKDPCDPPTNDWTVGVPLHSAGIYDWIQREKDVGCTDVQILDPDPQCGPELAIITITDAYPCYATAVTLEVWNSGFIPLIVTDVTITPINFTIWDPITNPEGEIDIVLWNLEGDPIPPTGPDSKNVLKIDLHVMQVPNVVPGATFEFTITIEAEQYTGPVEP
jgi:hypothetical protein